MAIERETLILAALGLLLLAVIFQSFQLSSISNRAPAAPVYAQQSAVAASADPMAGHHGGAPAGAPAQVGGC